MWKDSATVGGRRIELETGRIARQAHGAVLVREGKTVLLCTAVYSAAGTARDFFPLTVDYREYLSAAGRIPGGFLRREGRATDREVLASRLCDRSIRPLFPKGFRAETQVVCTLLSYDADSDAPLLAIVGASAALSISEIPWGGPLAAVRVGRVQGELVAFPAAVQAAASDLDLSVSVSREGVVMIEGGGRQVPDAEMVEAIDFAREQAQPLLALIESMREAVGRNKARVDEPAPPPHAEALRQAAEPALRAALRQGDKLARRDAVAQAKADALARVAAAQAQHDDAGAGLDNGAEAVLDALEARLMRAQIVETRTRVDGRSPEAIRPIACEVDWLPATHGSA
ncbi:MAG: polyribonucleotide nucleotidyltransferase, partial [Candidatus Lambdaproteobacteria bacterium]|nr:polyribonucleotide nucleotidyltransferase [Candidatus Lambdaproteobacteria bacterium]